MAEVKPKSSRTRRLLRLAAYSIAVVAICRWTLNYALTSAAAVAARRLAESAGLDNFRYTVRRAGLYETEFADLSADGQKLTVDRLILRYSPLEILRGKLVALELSGVQLQAKLSDKGLVFEGLAPQTKGTTAPTTGSSSGAIPLEALPDTVRVTSSILRVDTGRGKLALPFDGTFVRDTTSGAQGVGPRFRLQATSSLQGGQLKIGSVLENGKPATLDLDGDFQLAAVIPLLPPQYWPQDILAGGQVYVKASISTEHQKVGLWTGDGWCKWDGAKPIGGFLPAVAAVGGLKAALQLDRTASHIKASLGAVGLGKISDQFEGELSAGLEVEGPDTGAAIASGFTRLDGAKSHLIVQDISLPVGPVQTTGSAKFDAAASPAPSVVRYLRTLGLAVDSSGLVAAVGRVSTSQLLDPTKFSVGVNGQFAVPPTQLVYTNPGSVLSGRLGVVAMTAPFEVSSSSSGTSVALGEATEIRLADLPWQKVGLTIAQDTDVTTRPATTSPTGPFLTITGPAAGSLSQAGPRFTARPTVVLPSTSLKTGQLTVSGLAVRLPLEISVADGAAIVRQQSGNATKAIIDIADASVAPAATASNGTVDGHTAVRTGSVHVDITGTEVNFELASPAASLKADSTAQLVVGDISSAAFQLVPGQATATVHLTPTLLEAVLTVAHAAVKTPAVTLADVNMSLPILIRRSTHGQVTSPDAAGETELKRGTFLAQGVSLLGTPTADIGGTVYLTASDAYFGVDWPALPNGTIKAAGHATFGTQPFSVSLDAWIPTFDLTDGGAVAKLLPTLGKMELTGRLGARARLFYDGQTLVRWGEVTAANTNLVNKEWAAELRGLAGTVYVRDFSPFVTPPAQRLSIASARLGSLELERGVIDFQIEPAATPVWEAPRPNAGVNVLVEQAHFGFAGGEMATRGVRIFPLQRRASMVVTARDLQLTKLMPLVSGKGTEGDGTLVAYLPVDVNWPTLHFGGGYVHSAPRSGTIRMAAIRDYAKALALATATANPDPESPVARIMQIRDNLVGAIGDFAFDDLSLELKRPLAPASQLDVYSDLTQPLTARLHLSGGAANPPPMNQSPAPESVDVTININGLEELANRLLLIQRRVPQVKKP